MNTPEWLESTGIQMSVLKLINLYLPTSSHTMCKFGVNVIRKTKNLAYAVEAFSNYHPVHLVDTV